MTSLHIDDIVAHGSRRMQSGSRQGVRFSLITKSNSPAQPRGSPRTIHRFCKLIVKYFVSAWAPYRLATVQSVDRFRTGRPTAIERDLAHPGEQP
jgi:hypothetical protein